MAMHVHQQVARMGGHKGRGSDIYATYKGPDNTYFRLPQMRKTSPKASSSPQRTKAFAKSSLSPELTFSKTLKQYRGSWASVAESLSSPRTMHNTSLFSFQQADSTNKGFVELSATRPLIDRLCLNSDVPPLSDSEFSKHWFAVSKKKRGYVGFDEYMAFLQRVISTKAEVEKRKRRQEALDESKRTEENMKKTYYDDLHNPFKPQQLPDQSEDSLLHEILQQRLVNKLLKDNGADSDDDNPPLVVKKPVPGTDYDKVTGDVYWINRVTGEKTWTAPERPKKPETPPFKSTITASEEKEEDKDKTKKALPKMDGKQPKAEAIEGTPWDKIKTDEGEEYYYNRETGETSWEPPLGL